ncbi:MAG: RNA polymerase sigma factor [Solirubrobacteraceae bacterium]
MARSRPHELSENELVAAARRGDEPAFEALVERYSPRLRWVLFRLTRDQESAQDALQDALIRAWRNVERFQGRSSFFTWLTRIALNEAYRNARREEPRATLPLDDAVGERIPGWSGRPDEVFESREFLAAVDAALGRLPADYRVAVILRDVESLTTLEAAEVLGIEVGALKSRLHRGRMVLRRELGAFFAQD